MHVERLDHLVLTVRDVEVTAAFYERVLGMERVSFGEGRCALRFGVSKINLHPSSAPLPPHAAFPTSGSADLCFITAIPITEVLRHIGQCGITLEQGPVARSGALGAITSVYFRDPDGNLIEVSAYDRSP
jgi:catechol 2,3-dioxygenase-like lactoylglutathione lyase family enzyme